MSNRHGRKAKAYAGTHLSLCDLVHYDPSTGEMETLPPYKSTGTVMKDGYLHLPLPVDGRYSGRGGRKTTYFRADHVAWMLATGVWPSGWVEHVNGIRMDNVLENLIHVDAEGVRWWYGKQGPNEEPKLVRVEDVTLRVMVDGAAILKPVVVEQDRTARMRSVDDDPYEEDYPYAKGEFGVDWT